MKRYLWCCALVGVGLVGVRGGDQTIPLYENWGVLTDVPQIDAYGFANYGEFNVFIPGAGYYETANTLNYTNRLVMQGVPGFNFEYIDDLNVRRPAWSFYNGNGASINVSGDGQFVPTIRIRARDVFVRGSLGVEADGLIEISGDKVDVSRSSIAINPLPFGGSGGSQFPEAGIYSPDYGIFDTTWGLGPDMLDSCGIVTSLGDTLIAQVPAHCVTNSLPGSCLPPGYPTGGFGAFGNPISYVYTNEVTPTNWIIQIAMVAIDDRELTNFTTDLKLFDSTHPTNEFKTVTMQLATSLTNIITGENDPYTLYLKDTLASETNHILLTNTTTADGLAFRPGDYEFVRFPPPIEYQNGAPTNAYFRTNLNELLCRGPTDPVTNVFTNVVVVDDPPSVTTNIVTNIVTGLGYETEQVTNLYVGYGAFVTNVVPLVPDSPNSHETNGQGRVDITATTLNLERTRLRGEGHISIKTPNLVSASQTAIDVGSLGYSLGATNGTLDLQSVALTEVQRLSGWLYAWSGVWTNNLIVTTNSITNATTVIDDPDAGPTVTNDPGTNVITTNTISVGIHLMMVDARQLRSRQIAYLTSLETTSTNVLLNDLVRVRDYLDVDAESLTIQREGEIRIGEPSKTGALTKWSREEFPRLRYLTNNGVITVPNVAEFGTDGLVGYSRIVNQGTNVARSLLIKTDDLQAGGFMGTARLIELFDDSYLLEPVPGNIVAEVNSAKLQDGVMFSSFDTMLAANELKLSGYSNLVGGRLSLTVSNLLTDSGSGANNLITVTQGVQLTVKPRRGALLGTRLEVATLANEVTESSWAAADLGATTDGFVDNAAIGQLFVNPGTAGQIVFGGPTATNAIYVDYLEFSPNAMAALNESFVVKPGFVVYFAASNLSVDELESQYPGRMKWVNFIGPNSSRAVVVFRDANSSPPKTATITANQELLDSSVIDSDADGTANGFDIDPFSGATIDRVEILGQPPRTVEISWRAAAETTYRVDRATSLSPPDWELIRTYSNDESVTVRATVSDPQPFDGGQRYYRVTYTP